MSGEDRRWRHISRRLNPRPGDVLRAGVEGRRQTGQLILESVLADGQGARFRYLVEKNEEQAGTGTGGATRRRDIFRRRQLGVIWALPRPKELRRGLFQLASWGVGQIWIYRSWRVDKSYFGSRWLGPDRDLIIREGMEQGCLTLPPRIQIFPLFTRMMAAIKREKRSRFWLASGPRPENRGWVPPAPEEVVTQASPARRHFLVIGPEGGLTILEHDSLLNLGVEEFSLGFPVLTSRHALLEGLGRLYAQLGDRRPAGFNKEEMSG